MEKSVCDEKHKRIEDKLEVHERRLNAHGEKLDDQLVTTSKLEEKILSLIDQLKTTNSLMMWFIGLMVVQFVGFFFVVVQKGVLR